MSDSECDLVNNSTIHDDHNLRDSVTNKSKPKGTRVKKSPAGISKKVKTSDVFNVSRNGGEYKGASSTPLATYFVNKVANGNERRVLNTTGDYLVDFKVYRTDDARKTESQDLWRKALVRIKLQTNEDTPQWRKLQSLVYSIDSLCDEQPSFISNNS